MFYSYTFKERKLTLFYIALFGILGAWARYGQTILVQNIFGKSFPLATLSINVLGAFLMGLLFTLTLEKLRISGPLRTGILTGGLGAYTTFSTFSIEAYSLFQTGHLVKGGLYIVLSVVLGLTAVILGVWLAQR